jgi:hypothetical protein
MPKICDFETCRKQASYGELYGKPLRCKEHKENYNLVSQLCQHLECKTIPSFNFEGETQAKFCGLHKKENMINVVSKICEHPECKIRPTFNFEGEIKGKFCSLHKIDGMIDIKNKICQYLGCKTIPTFNFDGELKAKFCDKHKEEGMINVKGKTCEYLGCKTQPAFNFEGETQSKFCGKHKEKGMININGKTCKYTCCKTQPIYNLDGETKGKFCGKHKLDGMIDIMSKTCEYSGCKTHPNFNFLGETHGKFCGSHKEIGMIDIKSKKCKANFCLGTKANIKYKGYCAHCYQNLFPLDPLTYQIRCKTKEIGVRDYINENFEGFQHDKPLFTGNCDCTNRRRIDHRILIGNTLLCVETDESQHKSYDKKDEEIRYDDLYMLHSGKFIFIRFNPDKYKNKNKDNKSVNPMLYTRLPILKEEIEKQMDRIKNEENTELLEIIKLYYDSYN